MKTKMLLGCAACLFLAAVPRAEEAQQEPKPDKEQQLEDFIKNAEAEDSALKDVMGFAKQMDAQMAYLNRGAGDVDQALMQIPGPDGTTLPLLVQSDGKVSLLRGVPTEHGQKIMAVPLPADMFTGEPEDIARGILAMSQGDMPEGAEDVHPSMAVMMHDASVGLAKKDAAIGQGRIIGPVLSGAADAIGFLVPKETKQSFAKSLAKEGDQAARKAVDYGFIYRKPGRVSAGVERNLMEKLDSPGDTVGKAVFEGMTNLSNQVRGAVGLSPLRGSAVPVPAYTPTGHFIGDEITKGVPHKRKVVDDTEE